MRKLLALVIFDMRALFVPFIILTPLLGFLLISKKMLALTFIVLVCWIDALLRPIVKYIFPHRLSVFFIEAKMSFVWESIIEQRVSLAHLHKLQCLQIFDMLKEDAATLPSKLRPSWTYTAITHDTVISALIDSGMLEGNQLLCKSFVFSGTLQRTQGHLLGKKCKKCNTIPKHC